MTTTHTTLLSEAPGPSSPAHEKPSVTGTGALARSGRRAAPALLVALAALLALPLQAQAQTTLVSNTGQTAGSSASGTRDRAQAFTTGAHSSGYTLSSVEIISDDIHDDDAAVSVCTVDVNGFPTSTCTALTAPSSFAAGTLEFTGNMTLAASTTYTVLIATPGGETLSLGSTSSDSEDTGGVTGWSIDDAYDFKNSSDVWGTISSGVAFRIAVKGTVVGTPTLSTDARLSGLALKNASDGSTVDLNETFATGTKSYTAGVANDIAEITVEPASDNNATFAYLDNSDTVLTDSDTLKTGFQVDLSVGANTIKVKVTAEDTMATDTYTVVVTRAMAATPTVSMSVDKTTAVFKEDAITYTLTRTGSTTAALDVSVFLTQTKDFLLAADLSKTVTIAAGQSTNTFTVAAASFQHFAAGTLVEGGTLIAAVEDDDGPGGVYDLGTPADNVAIVIGATVGFEMASYSVGEADYTIAVKLIARTGPGAPKPSSNTSSLFFSAVDGSATGGIDYTFGSVGQNFSPSQFSMFGGVWQAEHLFGITITNDDLDEDDETFDLNLEYLAGHQNTPLVDASGNSCGTKCTVTATITDDDTAGTLPELSFAGSNITVNEDAGTATLTVELDPASIRTVTVDYTTSDETAQAVWTIRRPRAR